MMFQGVASHVPWNRKDETIPCQGRSVRQLPLLRQHFSNSYISGPFSLFNITEGPEELSGM